jgi:hypothetical protein
MLHDDDDPDRAPKHTPDEEGSFIELRINFANMPKEGEPIKLDELGMTVESHFHHVTSALSVDTLLMIAKGIVANDLPKMPDAIPAAVRDQITNMLSETFLRERLIHGPTHDVSVDAITVPYDASALIDGES